MTNIMNGEDHYPSFWLPFVSKLEARIEAVLASSSEDEKFNDFINADTLTEIRTVLENMQEEENSG